MKRRTWVAGVLGTLAGGTSTGSATAGADDVRLGVLQYGTVQWIARIVRNHGLDVRHGFRLQEVTLANTDAGRIALLAGSADVVVSDWIFAASQRAAGTPLNFAPFSSATGGVMVAASSPVRSLADLPKRKLGVAGGPLDKSWLIVRAAAQSSADVDLASTADIVYGAPPLLNAKLLQGELDAVLTYWNFAARLESAGCVQVISVAECARALGLSETPTLVGFVFHEDWAQRHLQAVDGFLTAAAEADALLAGSDAEWQTIRPLMQAQDDVLFQSLKRRFIEGIAHPTADTQQRVAGRLFDILLRTGGTKATAGLQQLPPGIFWRSPDG